MSELSESVQGEIDAFENTQKELAANSLPEIDITWEWLRDYHPLSYSSLKEFRKSPLHYKYYYQLPYKPPTDAMVLGLLAEHLLIEGDNWESKFIIQPEINRRTNAGKQEYLDFLKTVTDSKKTIIDKDTLDKAKEMVAVAKLNPGVVEILKGIKRTQKRLLWEERVEWNGKTYHVPMVGYVDIDHVSHLGHLSVDVKTAQSAEYEKFTRDISQMCYYLQQAIYSIGYVKTDYKFPKMMWLVMESVKPYGSTIIEMSSRDLEQAKAEVKGLLVKFVQCVEEKRFDEDYRFWLQPDKKSFYYFMPKWIKSPITIWDNE